MTGDYTYLDGQGAARVIQSGNSVTINCRWKDGDEYLFRAERDGGRLTGDWALIRENGSNVQNPIFRRYLGQVNMDCSIVGIGSDDPERRNIDGVIMSPAR